MDEIKELQECQLKILLEIKRICDNHSIPFFCLMAVVWVLFGMVDSFHGMTISIFVC